MLTAENALPSASEPASELLLKYLLQHLYIQTQVSYQLIQPLIFIFQLPQTSQFRHARPANFFFQL